jgi:hypothetical protein
MIKSGIYRSMLTMVVLLAALVMPLVTFNPVPVYAAEASVPQRQLVL